MSASIRKMRFSEIKYVTRDLEASNLLNVWDSAAGLKT